MDLQAFQRGFIQKSAFINAEDLPAWGTAAGIGAGGLGGLLLGYLLSSRGNKGKGALLGGLGGAAALGFGGHYGGGKLRDYALGKIMQATPSILGSRGTPGPVVLGPGETGRPSPERAARMREQEEARQRRHQENLENLKRQQGD